MSARRSSPVFFETTLTRERIERSTASGAWPGRLLNDSIDAAIAAWPARTAVVDVRSRLSYFELRGLADRAALAFLAAGVRPRDVVTVQLPNWNEFAIVAVALERIGAVVNPVAPIFRAREMRTILRLADPAAVVYPAAFRGFAYAEMYREITAGAARPRQVVVGEGPVGDGTPWDEFLEMGTDVEDLLGRLPLLRPRPDDVVELMFTSGTTGEPKGAMHTPNTIAAAVDPIVRALGLGRDDVFHMGSTLGHQTGFLYGLHAPLTLGARVVYQDVWDAAEFVRRIEAERLTFSMGATPFLADTLAAPNLEWHDTSSLRTFICAGAPIPRPLAERSAARLRCRLVPGWGMTELGLVTIVAPADPAEKIVTSDGRPVGGAEVVVRDEEGGAVAPGVEGDLWARGPATFAGYVQGRAATEKSLDRDGWFMTGDRARMDGDGYVRITGRTKDLVIRGGENVPVKEVEDVLLRHPKVRGVAVVAAPHDRLGEIGCACIVSEPGATVTLEDLQRLLAAEQVTRQFWPERLELVGELPMTASGKVQKYKLREMLAAKGS